MNILLTSAGRRTSLLKAFKDSAHRRGAKVFAGDIDGLAPALFMADQSFQLPKANDLKYIPRLLKIVEHYKIQLIIPTIDTELPILANAASKFTQRGCKVLVSSEDLVQICGDKWKFTRVFNEKGIRVPDSWLGKHLHETGFPERLFLKPREGSASQDTYRVHRDELQVILPRVPNPIIQEEIRAPEITIDALLDLDGKPIHFVPRIRIRTLGGESIQGVTLPDEPELSEWLLQVLEIISSLGGRGPFTLQAFLTEGDPTLSEINPRFGGGFPLTLAAGGDYPEWIMQMLEGKDFLPRIGRYKENMYMTRYYAEIFSEGPLWQ
ncbi:MAG: ATP-grasp domain-containing protein [Actinobacteria bacterium]|nr:ATP-grasp domain-containing protein [Actinomycetota bacterium]